MDKCRFISIATIAVAACFSLSVEAAGIVGPQVGPRQREVLVRDIAELELLLDKLRKDLR